MTADSVFQEGMTAVRKSTGEAIIILGFDKCIGSLRMWKIQSIVSGRISSCLESDIVPSQKSTEITEAFKNWDFRDYYAFRQAITHIRVKGELTNVLYSMGYGDVEFKPHQYKPVLKFITENRGRLLIADEVGLGKTVEALYIWKELQAREGARRILVVCPSSLTDKWQMDMKRLFSMRPQQVGAKEFLAKCEELAKDRMEPCCLVTSIEGIRSKERDKDKSLMSTKDRIFELLTKHRSSYSDDDSIFDLVIVDEAHIVRNFSTCNYKTVEALVGNSRNTVFLSATPIQTSSENLFNLLRILAPEEFSSQEEFNEILEDNSHLVSLASIFNKRYRDASINSAVEQARMELDEIHNSRFFKNSGVYERISATLPALLSDDEERVRTFNFITGKYFYSSIVSRTRKKDIPGENPVRQAKTEYFELTDFEHEVYLRVTKGLRNARVYGMSKVHEFVIVMKQREMASCLPAALDKWASAWRDESEESELYEEIFGDGDSDYSSTGDSFSDMVSFSEIKKLKNSDSKYSKFLKVIQEKIRTNPREKIIVFSFFKATLGYLEDRLRHDGIKVLRMDGSVDNRTELLKKFRDEDFSVLLSSEVGSEGIDLQFACIEINYDIPWNPMRLEQRIGRIDRIGQKSKFLSIINMVCNNTIEDRILLRLYDRIKIFERSIGETDDVLGKLTSDLQEILLKPELTDEERLALADQAITSEITNRQLQEELEEKAGITEAYGESIMKYIAETSDNNRFIRRDDLINYIVDFFSTKGKGSTITRCDGLRIKNPEEFRRIKLSDEAYDDYCEFSKRKSYVPTQFRSGPICCFPQGKTRIGYEGIDINHSLIRWIYDCNEVDAGKNGANCFALSVEKAALNNDSFEKGTYVFYIKEIKFSGIRIRRELFHVVMKVNASSPLNLVPGEYLLSQALFNGRPMTNLHDYQQYSKILNAVMKKCVDQADKLIEDAISDFQLDDESTYNIQMNRIERVHSNQKKTIQDTIDNHDRNDKYFNSFKRMQEGRIEKLDREYISAKSKLEKRRAELKLDFDELAVGIISVV
jgi:SNF2 family DNA or RNA helicase